MKHQKYLHFKCRNKNCDTEEFIPENLDGIKNNELKVVLCVKCHAKGKRRRMERLE